MPWYKQLHWQIIFGLVLGLIFGIAAAGLGWQQFVKDWIAPWGDIFIRLLMVIAVPLVLASLVTGVASLSDVRKLSRIGGKTIGIYLATTFVALVLGLTLVNVFQPGSTVPAELSERLQTEYQDEMQEKQEDAAVAEERGPLQPLVDIVPNNFLFAASNNGNMLQVVFFAIFMGIALLMLPEQKSRPLLSLFDSINEMVIKLVELIMYTAPVGVFALLAGTIATIAEGGLAQVMELLRALGFYSLVLVLGLIIQMVVTYPALLKIFTKMKIDDFFRGIAPAQLVAFSTSSSGATLPVTMESAEKNLGVSDEVSAFVLPLGATINMDGTAIYQAIAAVFISQTLGPEFALGINEQLQIVFLAMLASIGTAAVPSAGIIMLVIILETLGLPAAGIALILGVDRILDMCRTVTNVTGDCAVATVVAASEGELDYAIATASNKQPDVTF